MGLDAFVHCRCFIDGVVGSVPPFATGFDANGCLGPKADLSGAEYKVWHDWFVQACGHENMEVANAHISNWGGYRMFQAALEDFGSEKVPTLMAELPNRNGGYCEPSSSQLCLAELDSFTATHSGQTVVQLVDADTNSVINERVPAYDGVIAMNGQDQTRSVLTAHATLRVLDAPSGRTLFESSAFEQAILDVPQGRSGARSRLTDSDGQNAVVSAIAVVGVGGDDPLRYPRRFEVRTCRESPDRHDPIVGALRTVFGASVDTQMPVNWC